MIVQCTERDVYEDTLTHQRETFSFKCLYTIYFNLASKPQTSQFWTPLNRNEGGSQKRNSGRNIGREERGRTIRREREMERTGNCECESLRG